MNYDNTYYKCRDCGLMISHKGLKKLCERTLISQYKLQVDAYKLGRNADEPKLERVNDESLTYSTCLNCETTNWEKLVKKATGDDGLIQYVKKTIASTDALEQEELDMKFNKTAGGGNFVKTKIPQGMYYAKLKNVKEGTEGMYGARIIWEFEILDLKSKKPVMFDSNGEQKVAEIGVFTGCKFTPNSKETSIYKSLGGDYEGDEEVDTDKVLEKTAQAIVTTYKDKDGKDASGIKEILEVEL